MHADKYMAMPTECYSLLERMDLLSDEHEVIDLGLRDDIIERHDQLTRQVQQQAELSLPRAISDTLTFIIDLLLPRPATNQKWRHSMELAATRLQDDFQESISIPELATEFNMSTTHFRRVFVSFYEVSPLVYRIQKKIERIKSIILTEGVLMKEVAESFGYADVYTFSRQFKKYTGVSPTTFRDRQP